LEMVRWVVVFLLGLIRPGIGVVLKSAQQHPYGNFSLFLFILF